MTMKLAINKYENIKKIKNILQKKKERENMKTYYTLKLSQVEERNGVHKVSTKNKK